MTTGNVKPEPKKRGRKPGLPYGPVNEKRGISALHIEDTLKPHMILRNIQHERAAVERASGKTQDESYRIAFSIKADKKVSNHSCKLFGRPEVEARVANLRRQVADRVVHETVLTKQFVEEKLELLLKHSMIDYPDLNDGKMNIAGANKTLDQIARLNGLNAEKAAAPTDEYEKMDEHEIKAQLRALDGGKADSDTEAEAAEGTQAKEA